VLTVVVVAAPAWAAGTASGGVSDPGAGVTGPAVVTPSVTALCRLAGRAGVSVRLGLLCGARGVPAGSPVPSSVLPLPECVNQDAALNGKCETWRVADPTGAAGMLMNRSGTTVFVAGTNSANQFRLAAYNVSSGALRWSAAGSHAVPAGVPTVVTAVAVSPDGSRVFVTGKETETLSLTAAPYTFYLTVAYAASNGRELWAARYTGIAAGQTNVPTGIVVAPNSRTVFVTGTSVVPFCGGSGVCQIFPYEYATVAYNASSGRQLWAHGYAGVGSGYNQPTAITVGSSGARVYVTGFSQYLNPAPNAVFDGATVAYDTRSGRQLWVSRLRSPVYGGTVGQSSPPAIAVGSRDDRVFVTDAVQYTGNGSGGSVEALTVGYATRSGQRAWQVPYTPSGGQAVPSAVTVDPNNSRVYVVGTAVSGQSASTLTTLAYSETRGSLAWRANYTPPVGAGSGGGSVAVASGRVYVAGWVGFGATTTAAGPVSAGQYPLTLAYDATRGAQQWVARYDVRDPTVGLASGLTSLGIAVSGHDHRVVDTSVFGSLLALVGAGPPPTLTLAYAT
jgi:hypothetical protein